VTSLRKATATPTFVAVSPSEAGGHFVCWRGVTTNSYPDIFEEEGVVLSNALQVELTRTPVLGASNRGDWLKTEDAEGVGSDMCLA
jgi:hypothetical protein